MNAIKGALMAILSSLFFALVFAFVFRLPIPLAGMLGPFGDLSPYSHSLNDALESVVIAWLFYGAFGGFIVVPMFGAIAGFLAGQKYALVKFKDRKILLWSSVAGGIPVFLLSISDYIFGAW